MKELEDKYHRALEIMCRRFYVIAVAFLCIDEVKNGVFTISENSEKIMSYDTKPLAVYYLSLEDIELVYEAMIKSTFSSIHSRDQWGLILEWARKMAKERETT